MHKTSSGRGMKRPCVVLFCSFVCEAFIVGTAGGDDAVRD